MEKYINTQALVQTHFLLEKDSPYKIWQKSTILFFVCFLNYDYNLFQNFFFHKISERNPLRCKLSLKKQNAL